MALTWFGIPCRQYTVVSNIDGLLELACEDPDEGGPEISDKSNDSHIWHFSNTFLCKKKERRRKNRQSVK
jgi:hypothetical protein